MNPERQQAISYLKAPSNGLWHWAEDGAVVVWKDGTTLAFREELVQILARLEPNGLPPFGSVVFLLAACRNKLPTVVQILDQPVPTSPINADARAALLLTARRQLTVQLQVALAELGKVSALPPELICGVQGKSLLAEAIFEEARTERQVNGRIVLAVVTVATVEALVADQ